MNQSIIKKNIIFIVEASKVTKFDHHSPIKYITWYDLSTLLVKFTERSMRPVGFSERDF